MAIKWAEASVDDPIKPGEKCAVHQPMSYGSYIYRWPSKYDQVFWPLTDAHGVWHCKGSGFTAFIGEFEGMTPAEIKKISSYLARHKGKELDISEQLVLLEGIYALRATDDRFKNKLLRVLARWYQSFEDLEKANHYRQFAFLDIEISLAAGLPEDQYLEYLYLAANYSRFFGDFESSNEYIDRLLNAIDVVKDDKNKGFSGYLLELVKETSHITPGDEFDPVFER